MKACQIVASTLIGILSILLASFLKGLNEEGAQDHLEESCEIVRQIIGKPCEEFDVVTEDGFHLLLKRITNKGKKPVLLVHGLADSSATFVVSGKKSVASVLFDNGYDVWMLDQRGRVPHKHQFLKHDDDEFWEFGLDEIIDFDLPTAVDHIFKTTGEKIHGILGHSQGGLISVTSLASHQQVAEKVKSLIVFGSPIGLWKGSFFIPTIPSFVTKIFHPGKFWRFSRLVAGGFCSSFPSVCREILCLAAGCGSTSNYDLSTVSLALKNYPREVTIKNFQHLQQCDKAGHLHRFDYGEALNMKHYGSPTPPAYNLMNLSTPTALFYGKYDRFLSPTGFEDTLNALPSSVIKMKNNSLPYGHGCFIWSQDAVHLLYPQVLQFLKDI